MLELNVLGAPKGMYDGVGICDNPGKGAGETLAT